MSILRTNQDTGTTATLKALRNEKLESLLKDAHYIIISLGAVFSAELNKKIDKFLEDEIIKDL